LRHQYRADGYLQFAPVGTDHQEFCTILNVLNKAKQSQLLRDAAILASGTILAQAITILASPIITRIYLPDALGLYATFLALVTSLLPAATGRYEVALMLPTSRLAAKQVFVVALWFCMFTAAMLLLAVIALRIPISSFKNLQQLGYWLFLAPLMLFLSGAFNLAGYVANRQSRYGLIARSSALQAITIAALNIALGMAGADFFGLIIGNILGIIASLSYLLYQQQDFVCDVSLRWSKRKTAMARRYRDFPLFNASTGVLVGVTANLPVFLLVSYFSLEVAGFYALVVRVLNAPTWIISNAMSRVNLKQVVELVRLGTPVRPYVVRTSVALLAVSLPPAAVFVAWGPTIFSTIFGENWRNAGEIARIIVPAIVARFVASTMSTTLGATNNNRYAAIWRIVAFISTLAVLGLAAQSRSLDKFLLALVVNEVCVYLFYFVLIVLAAKRPRN